MGHVTLSFHGSLRETYTRETKASIIVKTQKEKDSRCTRDAMQCQGIRWITTGGMPDLEEVWRDFREATLRGATLVDSIGN